MLPTKVVTGKSKINFKQESPPAWMQETHHPLRSKYSLCCSVGGVPGVPPTLHTWSGVPHPDLVLGGYPIQTLSGGYPIQTWSGGTPHHPDLRWGTPQTWDGVPPYLDLGWGTPHLDLGWDTPLPRPGMGYPLPDLGWGTPYLDLRWDTPLPRPEKEYPPCKYGQSENITSHHPSDAGGKNCLQWK